jgi:hypothetical protein
MRRFGHSFGLSLCFASLYFALTFSFHLFGGVIDQPHPTYTEGNWFTRRIEGSFHLASVYAIVMFILVPIDLWCQRAREPVTAEDIAYYPRFNKIPEWVREPTARWTILLAVLFLAFYLASSLIEQSSIEQFAGGWVWPPERVLLSCLLLWGVFWIADCLCRPSCGTIIAAVSFTVFTIIFVAPLGSGFLRE